MKHRILVPSLLALAAAHCAPAADELDVNAEALTGVTTATDLRVEATLTLSRCSDPESGSCGTGGFRPRSTTASVRFAAGNELRKVLPGGRVRVGPFHIRQTDRDLGGPLFGPARYVIRLLGRSPAVYEPVTGGGARFVGADTTLREIARQEVSVSRTSQQDVYLTASLPGVFTALQVDAEIVGNARAAFPSGCGSLSAASASAPATLSALDDQCIQAVVAPTGILQPRYLPVSILYEPPGNCSWSNLTQQSIAGSVHGVTQESDTQTTTLRDVGPFWDVQHTEQWNRNVSATTRALETRVAQGESFGTRLGVPISAPGDSRCNNPGVVIPPRPDGGPGRGDVFVLLKDPQLLAWTTGSASNVAMRPGTGSNLVRVTAHQIATGVGLPPGVSFTEGDRRALLSLDPFIHATDPYVRDVAGRVTDVRVAPSPALGSSRYVFLQHVRALGAGLSIEHTLSQQMQLTSGQTLSAATRQQVSAASGDGAASILLSGVEKAATGLATAVGSLVPVPGFGALAGAVVDGVFPLYTNTTTRSVVTTLTATSLHERLDASSVAQQFHLQDTVEGISVEMYYDRLFGTYVFRRMGAGTGAPVLYVPRPVVIPPPVIRLP